MNNQTIMNKENATSKFCNVYKVFHKQPKLVVDFVTVTTVVLSLFALIANSLLVTALIWKKLTKSSTIIILCLSVVDLAVGASVAVATPFAAATKYDSNLDEKCIVTGLLTFLTGFLTTLSPAVTIVLAIQRYNHMQAHPEQRSCLRKLFVKPYIFVLVFVVALFSLLYPLLHFIVAYYRIRIHVFQLIMACIFAVVMLFVSTVYIKGYLRVRQFVDHSPIYQSNDGIVARPMYVRRLFQTVLLLQIILVATHLPPTIGKMTISIFYLTDVSPSTVLMVYDSFTMPFFLIGPCLHPLVVLRYNTDVKSWLRSCLLCQKPHPQQRN